MDPELPGGHQQGQREGEAGQQGERGVEYGQHLRIHTIEFFVINCSENQIRSGLNLIVIFTAYQDKTTINKISQVVSCSFVSTTDI